MKLPVARAESFSIVTSTRDSFQPSRIKLQIKVRSLMLPNKINLDISWLIDYLVPVKAELKLMSQPSLEDHSITR